MNSIRFEKCHLYFAVNWSDFKCNRAISAVQICINIAFMLGPIEQLDFQACFDFLEKDSMLNDVYTVLQLLMLSK